MFNEEEESLADSTNYGWGFEIGALLREEEVEEELDILHGLMMQKIIPYLMKEKSWDLLGVNDPEEPEVPNLLWQMAKQLDEDFANFPDFIFALVACAVGDLAPHVISTTNQIAEIKKELSKTRGQCNSSQIEEQILVEEFTLQIEEYSDPKEEVKMLKTDIKEFLDSMTEDEYHEFLKEDAKQEAEFQCRDHEDF